MDYYYWILLLIVIMIISMFLGYMIIKYNFSSYPKLKELFLDKINGNNKNYMNFGYWDEEIKTLEDANDALCHKLINLGPRANISNSKNILDIGCGHGEQDLLWANMFAGDITGVDIEQIHVDNANKMAKDKGLDNRLQFLQGNACDLKFGDGLFDTVISLESAFHYNPRKKFFDEAYRVLKPDGKLLIADIVKKKTSIIGQYLQTVAFNFLNVPFINNENVDEWVQQLKDIGYEVEYEIISDKTFGPYFEYISKQCCTGNFVWQTFFDNTVQIWKSICSANLPFDYIVAVCTKSK